MKIILPAYGGINNTMTLLPWIVAVILLILLVVLQIVAAHQKNKLKENNTELRQKNQILTTQLENTQTERQDLDTQLQTAQQEKLETQNQLQDTQTQLQDTQTQLQDTQTTGYTLQTQLRESETSRANTEQLLAKVQTCMVEGMLILNREDQILFVNDNAMRFLRLPEAGRGDRSIYELTDNQEFLRILKRTETDNRYVWETFQSGDQDLITRVYRDAASGITVIVLMDVTSDTEMEKTRQAFIANISQELKTPLSTIHGLALLFRDEKVTLETETQKYGEIMERESERLLYFIDDMMRLFEMEEQADLLNSPAQLAKSAKAAIQILTPRLQKKQITVTVEGDAMLLHSNENYLRELFVNLLENAVKYINPGGAIQIVISNRGDQAKIVMRDNGIGIPMQVQSRVFEQFYKGKNKKARQTNSTGFNLSLSKHIVDRHGGTISMRSEMGKGTEITVLLPIRTPVKV